MLASWVLRLVKQSVSLTERRVRRSMGRIELMESRTLLSAQLESSPAVQRVNAIAATGPQGAPLFPLGETFQLHSRPGATKVIYLDFNGQTVSGTLWNSQSNNGQDFTLTAYSFEGDDSFSNNELERIQRIWARVAEDFAPHCGSCFDG